MIKLTNKKEIKGDLLFLGGGSGPQPGGNVAWLTPTMLALFGIENDKPYNIGDSGYVEFYFLCREGHLPTIGIKMDGVDATNIGSDVMIPITEEVIQILIEEGFPEDIINEFRAYVGYFIMLGYGEVPPLTTGTHSITLKVDNLVYTDIIDYNNAFNYVTYVEGNSVQQLNEPARSTGEHYTYIQRITVLDPPQLGVLAPDGYYYFLVNNWMSDYYVKVPQPLDVDDEISVDGVTINGYFNPDYKLPHIPTSISNERYGIGVWNAHPSSQDWENVEVAVDDSNQVIGYYQLDGVGIVGNPGVDTVVELPSFNYNALSDWEIEVEFYKIPTLTSYIFYGSKSGTSKVYLRCSTTGSLSVGWYSNTATVGNIVPNRVYNIKKVGQRIYFDNVDVGVTLTSTSYAVLSNLKLFDGGAPAPCKVKSFKWLNNGNLTHNLVPAIYNNTAIDTVYGYAAFYDTVAEEWIGTEKFLAQGNIGQPVCLSYNTPIGRRNFTEIPNKLASTLPETYDGSPAGFGQQTSHIQYEYPTTAEYGMSVAYVGSWDEILAHSVMSSDGVLTYTPVEPLNNIYADGYSITGLNHPTGSSAQAVIDQVKFPRGAGGGFKPWTYPTGCVFTDTDGVKKILIGPLDTPGGEYTINAYRKYIKDHYSTTGIAIAYGITGDIYHYANVYDPLWRKSEGDGVDFITTVQPSYSEIGTITGN